MRFCGGVAESHGDVFELQAADVQQEIGYSNRQC
jgi:hypothetical protein